jgi:hypothetical protein
MNNTHALQLKQRTSQQQLSTTSQQQTTTKIASRQSRFLIITPWIIFEVQIMTPYIV